MNAEEFRADMVSLIAALISEIEDDYRASEEADEFAPCEDCAGDDCDRCEGSGQVCITAPSMLLTVGADANGWNYQTGDNSFSGSAYSFSNWSVVTLTRDSKPEQTAQEIICGFDTLEFNDSETESQ